MRINVYAEELTDRVEIVTTKADTGRKFYGVRCYLESSPKLHHSDGDDDSSAITFWVPWTKAGGHNVAVLQQMLERMLSDTHDIAGVIRSEIAKGSS